MNAAPDLTSSNKGQMEYSLMMKKLHEQKIREKGFQTLLLGASKVLCPLSGLISNWPYGQEVYITNIPSEMTEYELFAWFGQFGQIRQIRQPIEKNGASKTFAYVLYESRGEALNAVKGGNDMVFKYLRGSWKIQVKLSLDNRRIFVKNIPQTWTSGEMEQLVSSTCPGFKKIVLIKNHYCFLEFRSSFYAYFAIRLLKNVLREKAGDHTIAVNWANPEPIVDPKVMQKVKTLFIRGLKWEANQADVAAVLHYLLGLDRWTLRVKKEKDYAFVTFSTKDEAERAKKLLQGALILGGKISVCWARPNDPSAWTIPGVYASSPRQGVTPATNQRATGYSPMGVTGGQPADINGGQTGWNHQSTPVPEEIARSLRRFNLNETPYWNGQSEQLQVEPPLVVNYTPKYNWYKWSDGVDRESSYAADTCMPSLQSSQDVQVEPPLVANYTPKYNWYKWSDGVDRESSYAADTCMPSLQSSQDIQIGRNSSEPDATVGLGFPDFSKWTNSTDAQLL